MLSGWPHVPSAVQGALLLYLSMDFVQADEVARSTAAPGEHGRRYVLVRRL
jgi:hypothetical protein